MSVKFKHPQYEAYEGKWKRCRDTAAGQDAVHTAGEDYLPRLADQEEQDYNSYVKRAVFFNATWRTIGGLAGMVFRKPPIVEAAAMVADLLTDVSLDGTPFDTFSLLVFLEALEVGRLGILVDYPMVNTANTTQADALRLNLRPTMSTWKTEDIINWKTRVVNNKVVLSMVVLQEAAPVAGADEFEEKTEDQYRVLDLDDTNQYRIRTFRINKEEKDELIETLTPMMAGKRLDFVPFYFIGVDGVGPTVEEPPLIDLVDLNLSHYRTTADYEHGCHFTGLPTPYVSGYQKTSDEKLYIGSTVAWIFQNPETQVGFLEFSGEGLGALERNLGRKEQLMALLGARMLQEDKKAVESAETAGIHRSGEASSLATMANTTSLGLTEALRTFSLWAGSSEDATVELNTEFMPVPMDATMLSALVSAWQMGGISKRELFARLQKGEVISDETTFEEHEVEVEADIEEATARNMKAMEQQAQIEADLAGQNQG